GRMRARAGRAPAVRSRVDRGHVPEVARSVERRVRRSADAAGLSRVEPSAGHEPPVYDQRGRARPDGRGGRRGRGLRAERRGDVRAEVKATPRRFDRLAAACQNPPDDPIRGSAEDSMVARKLATALAVVVSVALAPSAIADINVGVTLSATGPAASLGIPEKNTFELLPTTIAGEKINWIVLDDASDTTKAVQNAKKLIGENKVDVLVGSTITPNSLAMVDIAAEAETPMISMAA